MALDKARLGQALWTKIKSGQDFAGTLTADLDSKGLNLWTGIAETIILEFTQNADVLPGTLAVIPANMSNSAGALSGSGLVANGKGKVL